MECNVIKDLLPLYIDECCSQESAELVEEHLKECADCRAAYENMRSDCAVKFTVAEPPESPGRLHEWKAYAMQSILFFAFFVIITVGVALESSTPYGSGNSFYAFNLVVPATGFLLSLANWYFVHLYKSRRQFSYCSLLTTLVITVGAYIWTFNHYEMRLSDIPETISVWGTEVFVKILVYGLGRGVLLTAVLCVLSKVLSGKYAKMLGKE